jgi:hypothetical protein
MTCRSRPPTAHLEASGDVHREVRTKQTIVMEDMPEEFFRALCEPYYDPEQAELDKLLE